MHVTAIVLAAGRGLRMKSGVPKPLVKINAKPVIIYSLEKLNSHPLVKEIILVANKENEKGLISAVNKYRISKISRMVRGGSQRQDSVLNALCALSAQTDMVLIHDGVRPFIDKKLISRVIKQAAKCGAAIAAVPVKATVKKVTGKLTVDETIDREDLWEIQTPQVFKKNLIITAYRRFGHVKATDDSMLAEKSGVKVRVVSASYKNIKITTPEDLAVAKAYLN